VIRQKVGIFEWVVNEETWALNETKAPIAVRLSFVSPLQFLGLKPEAICILSSAFCILTSDYFSLICLYFSLYFS
jgi:hypothetical protein